MADVQARLTAAQPSCWSGAAIGLAAGLASAGASLGLADGEVQFELLRLLPGIVFGVAFAACLWAWRACGALGAVFVAAANGLGNLAAVSLAISIAEVLDDPITLFEGSLIIGLPAGFLGAGLASLVFGVATGLRRPWPPILVGTLLGPLGPLSLAVDGLIPFFGLWQAGYGAALVWALRARTRKTT